MKADVISVGTELLLGQITDTNATYISQRLADIGVDVYFRTTVGDNQSRLCGALRQALGRADAVVITGGLGPTADDLTRESVAEAAGRALVRDERAARRLEEWFQRRNYPLAQINYKQATVPEGGRLIDNSCGTAPGLLVEHEGVVIFAVPGPPVEMRAMLDGDVIPYLRAAAGGQQLFSRRLRMCDIGESTVQERLADLFESQTDPTIAPYASPGEVVVRLSTKAADPQAAEAKLSPVEAEIRRRLGAHVYGVDEDSMAAAAGRALRERGLTLAVAESCTGGLITSRITDVPGASDYLLAGIVAYANQAKQDALGVPQELLEAHGAVSEPVARAMAEGARDRHRADFGLATTGIAGPGGGTETKPVGLAYIACAGPQETICDEHHMPGAREQFKTRASQAALNMLRKQILAQESRRGGAQVAALQG